MTNAIALSTIGSAPRQCLWCGVALIGRSDRQFCSPAHRAQASRAQRHAESAQEAAESATKPEVSPTPVRRHVTLLTIPETLDAESRRVVEYVNGEIERWNAGVRTEPLDMIIEAARDRVRRAR